MQLTVLGSIKHFHKCRTVRLKCCSVRTHALLFSVFLRQTGPKGCL